MTMLGTMDNAGDNFFQKHGEFLKFFLISP